MYVINFSSADRSTEDPQTEEGRRSKLTRGLTLLHAFRPQDNEVQLSELARRTGLPKPTVHRLIKELVDQGFLERGRRGLRLGHTLFLLGSRAPQHQLLRRMALPCLQRLNEATGGSAYLSFADGPNVVHLDAVHSPSLQTMRHTDHSSVCASAARQALASPAPAGPATGRQYTTVPGARGLVAVSTPVLGGSGTPVAALTVVGVMTHPHHEIAARHAQGAARTISRQLQEPWEQSPC
ncbi:helix-turn-helix domain-containing protein [Streptomyces griseoloalbus]|uniref:Helix-turn-helix domain-containing protein n=1 Tax=Streptomyces griseoloalbus TaxID=67303 RepID=A0ABV3E2H3_9ACTN